LLIKPIKPIFILTGPAASGKNTIGHLYATQFCERGAVIDVDTVRWMLRQPHVAPWDEAEGLSQHHLGVRHACMLAKSFVAENVDVIILDVLWADLPQLYRQELAAYPCHIVRLTPSWEESLTRLHARPHTITDEEARWVYDQQAALHDVDNDLDNTNISASEAAAWIASLASNKPI
jgi:hypothetical protein